MAGFAILVVNATQGASEYALTDFTYTGSGMVFATILFCRKGMYSSEDLAKVKQAGSDALAQDKPISAALLIGCMLIFYSVHQWVAGRV